MERHALLDFGAGYIQRSIDELPKQGAAWPWRLRMNYVADVLSIRHGALADSAMEFRRPHAKPATDPRPRARRRPSDPWYGIVD